MYSPIGTNTQNLRSKCGQISKNDHTLAIFNFITIGLLSACPWNAIPDVIYAVVNNLYNIDYVTEFPIIINNIIILGFVVFLCVTTSLRPGIIKWSCLLFGIVLIIIPITMQFTSHKSYVLELILFLITVRFTLYMGVILTVGSSIASILPYNYNGYISLGGGISGILSFGSFILVEKLIWPPLNDNPKESKENSQKTIWLLFGSATFACFVGWLLFLILMRKEWAQHRVRSALANIDQTPLINVLQSDTRDTTPTDSVENNSELSDKEGEDESHHINFYENLPIEQQSVRSTHIILKTCWMHIFYGSFSILITLLLFPLIGPYSWNSDDTQIIEIAFFLIFDLLGRLTALYYPFLSPYKLFFGSLSRVIFLILILLPKTNNPYFQNISFKLLIMIILSFSNGFLMTHSMRNAPESVHRLAEKGRVSAYNILFFHISITLGLYGSRLFKFILDNYWEYI